MHGHRSQNAQVLSCNQIWHVSHYPSYLTLGRRESKHHCLLCQSCIFCPHDHLLHNAHKISNPLVHSSLFHRALDSQGNPCICRHYFLEQQIEKDTFPAAIFWSNPDWTPFPLILWCSQLKYKAEKGRNWAITRWGHREHVAVGRGAPFKSPQLNNTVQHLTCKQYAYSGFM